MASKDQEIRKKKAEISSWLSQVFGPESILDFELNTHTINLLHQLYVTNQHNEKNAQLYMQDLQKKVEEYNADAQRLENILNKLMLGQNNFSRSGVSYIQALANTGSLLSVKDPSDTSYMLSIQELHSCLNEVDEKLQSGKYGLDKLSNKAQHIVMKQSLLQKALDDIKVKSSQAQAEVSARKEETVILKKSVEDNEAKIIKLKTELAKTGLNHQDFHDKLVKKGESLNTLKKELAPLNSELNTFDCLPPDAVETKIKIEQLKRELGQLQAQMSKCVDVALM